ncbi:hypothetical protein [Shewanella marina]|uniref:hypothetical protein n=1 Tax=Shewanella marina TaxID=487319 RepID=UPI00046F92AE|nr:hypothetical protein [Shewanella marina]
MPLPLPLLIGIIVVISIISFVLNFIVYLGYSFAYFIQDYWLILLALILIFAAIGIKEQKGKVITSVLGIFLISISFINSWYVSEDDEKRSQQLASQFVETYQRIGMSSSLEDSTITNILNTRFSSEYLLKNEGDFQEGFEKSLTTFLGDKIKNVKLYREVELQYKEFSHGGGKVITIINDGNGEGVFKITINNIDDIDIENI